MANNENLPSLKSASGAGFTFEDKVAAFLLCEMLAGRGSLGSWFGVTEKLERQAVDWEPFGDLRLTVLNGVGKLVKCGGSVKSNRQVSSNGCTDDLCAGLWVTMEKTVFVRGEDVLALFCSPLSQDVHQHLHSLCNQAIESDPARLDQKVVHAEPRKIYDSFRNPNDTSEAGLPGHILAHFVSREFDFEDTASRDAAEALRLCREVLSLDTANDQSAADLWNALLLIAQTLRTTGGEVTREKLATKLRPRFKLRDDPCDETEWSRIRNFSNAWLSEIDTALPGGFTIPRVKELQLIRGKLVKGRVLPLLGETGLGKSALVKLLALEFVHSGAEVVWMKADRFDELCRAIPKFVQVCRRTRRDQGLIVFDAVEGCYEATKLKAISQTIQELTSDQETSWHVVLTCQTPGWDRVLLSLIKHLGETPVLMKHLEFTELSDEDFAQVCGRYPSVARLAEQAHLSRVLKSPKMLDVLLGGQLAEDRVLVSEADMVEWWWEKQVRGANAISAEERVACNLAIRMADELCTELPPDAVAGSEEATKNLARNRVLRITGDRRLKFQHDLLADWSRVMHLRSLGTGAVTFMRTHAQNPPWLRAIRLLSQHLLERATDLERWRGVVAECSVVAEKREEPSAENLQVLDAWLEGIAFCAEPGQVLTQVKDDLFDKNGNLLRRWVRRLLFVATLPDPVIEDNLRRQNLKNIESAIIRFRLPHYRMWWPVVQFFVNYADAVTEYIPVELAEFGEMWARFYRYIGDPWPVVAGLILLNAEKELRREVAGHHRFERGPISLASGNKLRVAIYAAGLFAGSEHPDRAVKLALKATGRAQWDDGDVAEKADRTWLGEWEDSRGSRLLTQRILTNRESVSSPPESWPDGPGRRSSTDFCQAWLESGAARALFKQRPEAACEITMASLLQWPKFEIADRFDFGRYHYGFNTSSHHLLSSAFWTRGPFLVFLRENWRPALDMIIRLTNFATARYSEWWEYGGLSKIVFKTPSGDVSWEGNIEVYRWNRFHMNTSEAVTCSLMALEKWLEDQVAAGETIEDAVKIMYRHGRSLAFAGVLIGIGKRHPELFLTSLKPLLFVREFYLLDAHAARESTVSGYAHRDAEQIKKMRREWNELPGRKTPLLDFCCDLFLKRPEFDSALQEVSADWRQKATEFPADSEDQIVLLRWASNFDHSVWKEVTLPDGTKAWRQQRPAELRDPAAERAFAQRQTMMTLPIRCADLLTKRPQLDDQRAEQIWQSLQTWPTTDAVATDDEDRELAQAICDPGHGKAGMLAVLLCLGRGWLRKNPDRHAWVKAEVQKLLEHPPKIIQAFPEDINDDGEGFLARCAAQCWADEPASPQWRGIVGSFVLKPRYHTVQVLFHECLQLRQTLGGSLKDLQALAVHFAAVREKANRKSFRQPDAKIIDDWAQAWLPIFAAGQGPIWPDSWEAVETVEDFPQRSEPFPPGRPQSRFGRRNYGFDMGVILAAFGDFPPLSEAIDEAERRHWLKVCSEILGAFLRTLPPVSAEEEEWEYDIMDIDQKTLDLTATRLFQCSPQEQADLWKPLLNLPTAAHHYITDFLDSLILESVNTEPPRINELQALWRQLVEYLFSNPQWEQGRSRECHEVWTHIFLHGTPFSVVRNEIFIPFVQGLRDLFERHVKTQLSSPYEQSSFAAFLTTKAGDPLLVDAFAWLEPNWEKAGQWFWTTVAEHSNFPALLGHAWQHHFAEIRKNPEALTAFKIITLKMASQQIPIALAVQGLIGATR